MKHFFIVNPAAGTGKKLQKILDSINEVCQKRKEKFFVHRTTKTGEATEYVKGICRESTKDEKMRFYACGGDGTINETASGIIGCENAELAIIPLGTGNDFVRNFENSEKFFDIDAQLDGTSRQFDILRCNDRYCVNMINIGFDCEVVKQVPKIKKLAFIPGKLAFIIGVVQKLISMPGVKAKIFIDGIEQKISSFLLCAIANGAFCGGGFKAAPLSGLNDGVVDICMVKPISRTKFINLVGAYKNGTYVTDERFRDIVKYEKCSEVEIKFDTPTDICIDGEIEQFTNIKISTIRNALNLCVPKGSFVSGERENQPELTYV